MIRKVVAIAVIGIVVLLSVFALVRVRGVTVVDTKPAIVAADYYLSQLKQGHAQDALVFYSGEFRTAHGAIWSQPRGEAKRCNQRGQTKKIEGL